MKVAVIGSRSIINIDLSSYLPAQTTEIVSGGAKGVDSIAADYAKANRIKLTLFLPEYEKYGRAAPLKRNEKIVAYSDYVLAFWNGTSLGTRHVLALCEETKTPVQVITIDT